MGDVWVCCVGDVWVSAGVRVSVVWVSVWVPCGYPYVF